MSEDYLWQEHNPAFDHGTCNYYGRSGRLPTGWLADIPDESKWYTLWQGSACWSVKRQNNKGTLKTQWISRYILNWWFLTISPYILYHWDPLHKHLGMWSMTNVSQLLASSFLHRCQESNDLKAVGVDNFSDPWVWVPQLKAVGATEDRFHRFPSPGFLIILVHPIINHPKVWGLSSLV